MQREFPSGKSHTDPLVQIPDTQNFYYGAPPIPSNVARAQEAAGSAYFKSLLGKLETQLGHPLGGIQPVTPKVGQGWEAITFGTLTGDDISQSDKERLDEAWDNWINHRDSSLIDLLYELGGEDIEIDWRTLRDAYKG